MTSRLLPLALLVCGLASSPVSADIVFTIAAAVPPGQGGEYGSISYTGPNDFGGTLLVNDPGGFVGTGTPLNSGTPFGGGYLEFYNTGNSGSFYIYTLASTEHAITGTFTGGSVGSSGGTMNFTGHLSASEAAFYGVDPNAEMAGTFQIFLSPAMFTGPGGSDVGSAQITFSPDGNSLAAPEPGTMVLAGVGVLAFLARRWWKGRPGS